MTSQRLPFIRIWDLYFKYLSCMHNRVSLEIPYMYPFIPHQLNCSLEYNSMIYHRLFLITLIVMSKYFRFTTILEPIQIMDLMQTCQDLIWDQ